MQTHVTGQPAPGELRQHVLAELLGNPLFSEAEQLRATHFVHECEDPARLLRRHAQVLTEIARRAAAVAYQWAQAARQTTLRQLQPPAFRGHCPRKCPLPPAGVPGAAWLTHADQRAGTLDQHTAARFQPGDSLTLAHLFLRARS